MESGISLLMGMKLLIKKYVAGLDFANLPLTMGFGTKVGAA